jgi:hypothetical protein
MDATQVPKAGHHGAEAQAKQQAALRQTMRAGLGKLPPARRVDENAWRSAEMDPHYLCFSATTDSPDTMKVIPAPMFMPSTTLGRLRSHWDSLEANTLMSANPKAVRNANQQP